MLLAVTVNDDRHGIFLSGLVVYGFRSAFTALVFPKYALKLDKFLKVRLECHSVRFQFL